MIQEKIHKDKLKDINITTEETKKPDHNVIVDSEEMDITLSVDPSSSYGTDSPVVAIAATAGVVAAQDVGAMAPEMAPAAVASIPVTSGVPATATSGQTPALVPATASNAVAADGASAPDCSANLTAALGQIPVPEKIDRTATTSGTTDAPSGTRRVSATFYIAGREASANIDIQLYVKI